MIKCIAIMGITGMTFCTEAYTEKRMEKEINPPLTLHTLNDKNSLAETQEEKIVYFVSCLDYIPYD